MSSIGFVGEFSPLESHQQNIEVIHWQGVIYNRDCLVAKLNAQSGVGILDDPSLIASAILKWGDEVYKNLEGRYLLIYRSRENTYAVRGAYDSPELFYASVKTQVVFSLNLETLLYQIPAPIQISITALVHQFSFLTNEGDTTPFRDIQSLAAGQALNLTQQPYPKKLPVHRPHQDTSLIADTSLSERWRATFLSTINEIATKQDKIGLFLSGGLDSGALAAVAKHNDIPIKTITFGLSQHPSEDESEYGASLAKALSLEHHHLEIQSACFQEIESFPISLRRPALNPYQRMINEGYECANQLGITSLWTGSVGDDIYPPKRNVLRDLWRDKKFLKLISAITRNNVVGPRTPHSSKTLFNYIIKRKSRNMMMPSYINSDIGKARQGHLKHPLLVGDDLSIHHRSILFHADNINGLSYERAFTDKYKLERVHPYMHPALIELGLRTPAYQAHSKSEDKAIVRLMLEGMAPKEFIHRKRVGVLNDYFLTGWNANFQNIQSILFDKSASWPQFVCKATMIKMLDSKTDAGYMLASNCLALELWLNQLRSKGLEFQFV